MEIFFADGTQQKGVRDGMGQLVSLGGIFVDAQALRPFAAAVDQIATVFGIPKGEELEWSPHEDAWIHQNLVGEDRTNCYRQVIEAARDLDVRALVVVWDTGRTILQGEKVMAKCLNYVLERISMYLATRNDSALIVADRPGGGNKQEDELLPNLVERVQEGTQNVVPDNVVLNILTTPSHLTRHLQAADLVTGITTEMVGGQYDTAAPLFDLIRPMLITSHFGTVGDTGLKLFPEELVNLYHWVLGEEAFSKAGHNGGFGIPNSEYPFGVDEFIAKVSSEHA